MPTTDCSNKEDTDKTYVEQVTETCFFFSPRLRRMAGDRRQTSVCPAAMFNKSAFNAEQNASKMYSSIIALCAPIRDCTALESPRVRKDTKLWNIKQRKQTPVSRHIPYRTHSVLGCPWQASAQCWRDKPSAGPRAGLPRTGDVDVLQQVQQRATRD